MGSWNFTESGHGKGAADGIGGVVKRTADAIVSMGTDISDAKSFYEEVSKRVNNVRLFLIASEDIDKVTASIPTHIPTIKGTMKLHQVVINIAHRGIMHLRELSCFCTWPTCCKCYIAETSECILMSQHDSVSPSNNDADKRCETGRTTNMDCRSQGVFTHDTIYREPQTPPTDVEALKTPKNVDPQKILTKIEPHPDLIGNWCVVRYDDKAYPGIIQDLDDDSAEVKVMHRIGENRYFWPYLEDCIWYNWENLLMLIPEPLHVTGRHVQIDPSHWTEVKHMLNE
ncbi:uncharacterized protein LOC123530686 [Mercenaria mercenaria]|uniref:uncharacterized protein LOC123530686 n=1 Tax=Mercenaria mercenaria TaxID=6596 RepID=UPI00234E5C0C|nr:uncharacterized protein LOC123530686 [Mercenaria mercenaria]